MGPAVLGEIGTMRIGLVDVDSSKKFPNLALMKISRWHKNHGDQVEWAMPLDTYDKVYQSKVFNFTPDDPYDYGCETEKGGTGYSITKVLPDEIEHTCPDYSLYGINDTAYGFTTRGCIRKCPFCLVSQKEGGIRAHADLEEFLDGRTKVVLMDNNIVACDHGIRQLEKCRDMGLKVDINQGLDARVLTKDDQLIRLIAELKDINYIRLACDCEAEIEPCENVIIRMLLANPRKRFIVYCILTDNQEDSFSRVNHWRKYGHQVAVYAPPFRDFTDPGQVIPRWQKDLARWANNRYLYYSCEFADYARNRSGDE